GFDDWSGPKIAAGAAIAFPCDRVATCRIRDAARGDVGARARHRVGARFDPARVPGDTDGGRHTGRGEGPTFPPRPASPTHRTWRSIESCRIARHGNDFVDARGVAHACRDLNGVPHISG